MRVLIDDFGAVLRLGFKDVLIEEGMDVVAEDTRDDGIFDRLIQSLPDVVVIDLDTNDSLDRARGIAKQFPSVKVIACSSRAPCPRMRVFPPFHRGESYTAPLDWEKFLEAVKRPG